MALVVDCSFLLTLCFEDEASVRADALLDRIALEGATVPAIWWFELRNALIVGERRGRIHEMNTTMFLNDIGLLPIEVDREPVSTRVVHLARAHRLTVYDSAYLELAQRRGLRLATLDHDLAVAAESLNVSLF